MAEVSESRPAAEVSGGCGIRNRIGSSRVEQSFVVPQQFEMFQSSSPAQHVQYMGHHMIGFLVRSMHFQQMNSPIDLIDESGGSCQLHHHANTAMIDRMNSF